MVRKVNKKRFWISLIILLLIGAIILFSFKSKGLESNVKIGVLLPLSGDFADFGAGYKRGIDDSIQGGFEFVFEDDKCDPIGAINGFRKLTDIDNVKYIIGPGCGSPQEAIAPLMREKEVIAILPSAAFERLYEESEGKIFQMQYSLEEESKYLANKMFEQGYPNVVMVTYPNVFSKTHADSFKKNFKGSLREVAIGDYSSDIYTEVTKIKEINPDAIFITDASFFLINGLEKLDNAGINAVIFSHYVVQFDAIRSFVDGVYYSFPGDIKEEKGFEYWLGKRSSELFMEVINKCNDDFSCVLKEIPLREDFDDKGISTRPIVLKRMEKGIPIEL